MKIISQQKKNHNYQLKEQNYRKEETKQISTKKKYCKIIIISIIFVTFLLYRFLFSFDIKKHCVYDYLHEITFNLNRTINKCCSHVFIGISQVTFDLIIPSMLLHWIIFVKNYRLIITMLLIFLFRTSFFITNTMPYTSYQIWESPGFFTLVVPYDKTSDYFYSGHTAALVFFCLETINLKLPEFFQYFGIISFIYTIILLIVFRVHYFIDIFGAFLYSYYFFSIVNRNIVIVDKICNFPYQIIGKAIIYLRKICKNNQQEGTSLYEI